MKNRFNDFREKNNLKAGDRILVSIDQDVIPDNIIYISFELVKCDLLNGIDSNFIKVDNVEIENINYGEDIDEDIVWKLLNIKTRKLHLYLIREYIRKY
jgi:hypothetical protein